MTYALGFVGVGTAAFAAVTYCGRSSARAKEQALQDEIHRLQQRVPSVAPEAPTLRATRSQNRVVPVRSSAGGGSGGGGGKVTRELSAALPRPGSRTALLQRAPSRARMRRADSSAVTPVPASPGGSKLKRDFLRGGRRSVHNRRSSAAMQQLQRRHRPVDREISDQTMQHEIERIKMEARHDQERRERLMAADRERQQARLRERLNERRRQRGQGNPAVVRARGPASAAGFLMQPSARRLSHL